MRLLTWSRIQFDEILKYCNELSMTIELDTTLAQAEVLFLSFAQIVADIDRRTAEERSNQPQPQDLRRRNGGGSSSGATTPRARDGKDQAQAQVLAEDLRELLKAGR